MEEKIENGEQSHEVLPLWNQPGQLRLRKYQQWALDKVCADLDQGEHPVCALATGSGKSLVIAALAMRRVTSGRVLVATHRQELLEQNESTLMRYANDMGVGVYSAGLERRETDDPIIFAGVQSVYRRMRELQQAGPFCTVIVDECHLVQPPSVETSMYAQIFRACEGAARVGLTATPYRLKNGLLHEGEDTWFTSMPVNIGISEFVKHGFLAPLKGIEAAAKIDTSQVSIQAGEYNKSELSQAASDEALVARALLEVCSLARDRKKWLVFCVDVAHTELVHHMLCQGGIPSTILLGSTPQDERVAALGAFREGKFRALVNCEVATTGFDIPDVDCIVMLRPTKSKALCVQMLGRGTRLAEGKENCLILDFAGNCEEHEPLDGLPEVESSPELKAAREKQEAQAKRERELKHSTQAYSGDPMSAGTPLTVRVAYLRCSLQRSKKYPAKHNLVLDYHIIYPNDRRASIRQWLCVEYDDYFSRNKTRAWFQRRGLRVPSNAYHARAVAERAPLPSEIVIKKRGKWYDVVIEKFIDGTYATSELAGPREG